MSESRGRTGRLKPAAPTLAAGWWRLCLVLAAACLSSAPALAGFGRRIGPAEETSVLPPRDPCSGALAFNHDASFENGYAWESYGAWPEYYGAWGEAFDLGACHVVCGAYWVSTLPGYYEGQLASLYVWEGGVTTEPGAVLFTRPDVQFDNIPLWPEIGQNDASIGASVSGEFTIGFWGNWGPPFSIAGFFIAADVDGAGGRPWTYIAPDLGVPSGWQHPNVVGPFDDCHSLGIGLYYDDVPSPAEASSWGRLKALFGHERR